jgi:sulfofructose kinase
MMKQWDVLGLGSVAVDDLLYVEHFPQPDEKIPIKMRQRQGGGLIATGLVAAARQGARAAYCGRLGDDELSNFTRTELNREGVDISPIQYYPGGRPFHSTIVVSMDTNTRAILYDSDGVEEPDLAIVTEELIRKTRVLFLDHYVYYSGIKAAQFAHKYGIPVVGDIEDLNLPNLGLFLSQIDHLIVGIQIARKMTGLEEISEMVKSLAQGKRKCCVITAGSRGCWYAQDNGEVIHVPAYSVNVLDTTGCGDVFHGAYAASIARGEPIDEAIRIATATAAIKATALGGRKGIPSLLAVRNFLEHNTTLPQK